MRLLLQERVVAGSKATDSGEKARRDVQTSTGELIHGSKTECEREQPTVH